MLRVVPEVAIPAVVSPEGPTRAQVRSRSIAEAALFEQAAALGFACLPIDKIEKEIAAAMVTRMRTRSRGAAREDEAVLQHTLLRGSGLDEVAGGGALRSRLWPVYAL